MVKEREDYRRTRCAICWHDLRPKSPLLRGTKCIKCDIKNKLKYLLPAQDFRTLYDENIFTNPRICNMCFGTIRKIPRTITKLQSLVGKKINTKLYKPHRAEWCESLADTPEAVCRTNGYNVTHEKNEVSSPPQAVSQLTEAVIASLPTERKVHLATGKKQQPSREISPEPLSVLECDSDAMCSDLQLSDDQQDELDQNSNFSEPMIFAASTDDSTCTIIKDKAGIFNKPESPLIKGSIQTEMPVNKSDTQSEDVVPVADGSLSANAVTIIKLRNREVKSRSSPKNFSSEINKLPVTSNKKGRKNEYWPKRPRLCQETKLKSLGRSQTEKHQNENKLSVIQKGAKKVIALRRTRRTTRIYKSVDVNQITDISHSESDSEYLPLSGKMKRLRSSNERRRGNNNLDPVNTEEHLKQHRVGFPITSKSIKKKVRDQQKNKLTRLIAYKNTKAGITKRMNEASSPQMKNAAENIIMTDIPGHLSEHSKSKLLILAKEAMKYFDGKKESMKKICIKCSVSGCGHMYPLWLHVAIHMKYYHFDGALSSEDDFTQKLSMLANLGELDNETYRFKCRNSGCKLTFTSEENLQEHESAHGSELVLICGFPDCTKAFKTARSLHIHFRSHTGQRPFLCTEPGCGKVFKDSKELSRHKSRHVGGQPCVSDGQDTELHSRRSIHTKADLLCCDVCGKQYASEKSLLRHKRRIHGIGKPGRHRCPYKDCDESFVKKEKLEIHLCTHSPELRLFCEKCGKKFSCQRYLDVHYKIHIKNEKHATSPPPRTIRCEFPECDKMFTTRENMKSHVLNQHRGRKPKSVPGVFFPCLVKGCEKKFSFRSTLYRHNKLVHKGGDYKLGREVVKYVCNYKGCCKEFNRKNLLEEHMVMEHGKTPKRLLPLQNKELDFIERICMHCGMVLTVAQLPRHEEVYHSDKAIREMKENSPYPCHMKACEQVFNTQEDRKSHVQDHVENPFHRCQVGKCTMTFFLEKNFDNHLWYHSRKMSVCDYEGCSQTFEDQLQLAKHSKFHYDGKMKCPWPNCDNWLTETGHLKPHFIAHSRSLRANLDCDFICEICELAFNSKWGLMIHKRMHGEEAAAKTSLSRLAKFLCEEDGCQAKFADQKGFFDHFLFHYTNVPASCDFDGCTESFRNMVTMSRHTKHHYNGKFKCPWRGCVKLFASVFIVKRHLYRHIISNPAVASSRLYSCSQCFMIFKSEANHASHLKHHNEKSDYVCPTCGKKGRHNHLKAQRLGNKPRKLQECQQCGARYATVSGLKFHLLQKHKIGKWPFKCNYCGKGFVSSREMQRHIPSHTKEKPFACELCDASFASHTGHRAHMRKHTGEKYVCDVEGCGKIYTTSISLRGHKAQHEGFSKICHFCCKTYKNPYGHKCKAGRDSKRKMARQGPNQVLRPPMSILAPTVAHSVHPLQAQQSVSSLASSMVPATTSLHRAVIMPQQQVVTHTVDVHQVTGAIMAANTITQTQILPGSLPQGISHSVGHDMLQPLPHSLHNQGMMPDRGQPGPMDMTRGAPMEMAGDYTYNNYVVFWENQNVS